MISNQSLQRKEKIKTLVLHGEFSKAKDLASLVDYETLRNILLSLAFDYRSICAYTFVFFLLFESETIQYHALAQELLDCPLCYLEGAYKASMYHAQRSIELDPNDVELKEALLFFNDIPCKPLKDKEAKKIALEIIQVKKESDIALDTITKLSKAKQE